MLIMTIRDFHELKLPNMTLMEEVMLMFRFPTQPTLMCAGPAGVISHDTTHDTHAVRPTHDTTHDTHAVRPATTTVQHANATYHDTAHITPTTTDASSPHFHHGRHINDHYNFHERHDTNNTATQRQTYDRCPLKR